MSRSGARSWPRMPAGIAYGGDYNPEQWPEATWHEDVALMREAGVNLVSVGVFAWSRLQPEPGRWDLDWLERILDLLHANGVAVDLATATATTPPWFALRHPESLPVTAEGVRLGIGTRQHQCPSSAAYREASAALVERLAVRFGSHPGVVMWHVGNEYGDHVMECFCAASAADFRTWLRARYGDLDTLNEAWLTDVWSGRCGFWDEVMPPAAAPAPHSPPRLLDWRRFSSDAFLALFEAEREILARITPDLPATTNFMRLNPGIDHWRWAARQDLISADLYPDPAGPAPHVEGALNHDLMRSLGGGRPWLLMEQARSAVDWRPVNMPKRPGQMRAMSLEAVARGADGILFFQWRGSRGGPEALHSTLLPAGGTDSRGWQETVALGRDLARLGEVAGSQVRADTAMLLDWNAWWALEQPGHPSDRLLYAEQVGRFYAPLHAANVAVDMRAPGDSLSEYRLVVAPNLFLLDPAAAAALLGYVRGGGTLVVGPFSGVVDTSCHIPPGHYPGLLRDLLGVRWEEVWPIPAGDVAVEFDVGEAVRATLWRDAVDLAGAVCEARYADGDLAGWPAVTRHAVGAGVAWYLGTVLDAAGMDRVMDEACRDAGVRGVAGVEMGDACPSPAGSLVVARREAEDASYLWCVNHGPEPVEIVLTDPGTELLGRGGLEAGARVVLAPFDVVVVRQAARPA
jgi:beta-galactosidase